MKTGSTNDKDLQEKIRLARAAHQKGNADEEMHQTFGGMYIRDIVYGANDGIITTFAVVAGVAGAGLEPRIVLILGFANLFADALSMAAGNYLGTKSELEYHESERKMEAWEIEYIPEEERKEIREVYERKGFEGKDLDRAVEIITSDRDRWLREMMIEEHGFIPEGADDPRKNAFVTFVAFALAGTLPLMPYVFGAVTMWPWSIVMTGVALFVVGSARTWITGRKWLVAGIEMLLVGAVAASVAYGIGFLIESMVS